MPFNTVSDGSIKNVKNGKFKRILLKILVPAALVVSIGIGVFVHPVWRNSFLRSVMSEKAYFKYVVGGSARNFINSVIPEFELFKNTICGHNMINLDMKLTIGKDEKDNIKNFFGPGAATDIPGLNSAGISAAYGKNKDLYALDFGISFNGLKTLGLNGVLAQDGLYVSIPELNDSAVLISAGNKSYGGDITGLFNRLQRFDKIMHGDKVAGAIIKKCGISLFESIYEVRKKDLILTVGDVRCPTLAMTINLKGEDIEKTLCSCLKEIKKDKDIKALIKDLCKSKKYNFESMYADFGNYLDNITEKLESSKGLRGKEYTICFFVNREGQVTGFDFDCNGNKLKYYNISGDGKRGTHISFESSDFAVSYEGSDKRNAGNRTLCIMGMDVLNVKAEYNGDGAGIKSVTVVPGDDFSDVISLLKKDKGTSMDFVKDLKVTVVPQKNLKHNKSYTINASVKNKNLGTLEFAYDLTQKSNFDVPDLYVDFDNKAEMESWQSHTTAKLLTDKKFAEIFEMIYMR